MTYPNHEEIIHELLQEGLGKGRSYEFQVISPSMFPLLKIGDKVILQSISAEDLRCGDIVAYKNKDRLIIHRFLSRNPDGTLLIKGDACTAADLPIGPDRLFGKASAIEGKNKKIDLEFRRWKITNALLGKANLLKVKTHSAYKNLWLSQIANLLHQFAKLINRQYSHLVKSHSRDFALEKRFIMIATKKIISEEDLKILEDIIDNGIDWQRIVILALYNNVGPILYKNLHGLPQEALPQFLKEELKRNYTESFLKTAPMYRDLSKLLEEVKRSNIQIIILKGCSFAEQLYQDFSLRPLKDVDILAKKSDWPEIKEILLRLGFKGDFDLLQLINLADQTLDWHIGFFNDNGTKLEIRFNLFVLDFPWFEVEGYWKEAITAKINQEDGLSLSLEDNLLYLTTRLVGIGFGNFLWFCDLREFIRIYQKGINWERLLDKAKHKRINSALYYTLLILNQELEVAIPKFVLRHLKPNSLKLGLYKLLLKPENLFFTDPLFPHYYPSIIINLAMFIDKFTLRPTDIKKLINYLRRMAFPPLAYLKYRYNLKEGGFVYLGCYWHRIKRLFGGLKIR